MQSKIDSGSEMLLSNISTRNRNLQLNVKYKRGDCCTLIGNNLFFLFKKSKITRLFRLSFVPLHTLLINIHYQTIKQYEDFTH